MSHTNETPNYSLPLYVDNDRPTWRGDVNDTNTAIDTALKEISDSIPTGPVVPPDAAIAAYLATRGIVVVKTGGAGLTAKELDELSIFTDSE